MLIAIEGIDGAGKTYIARKLAETLTAEGVDARYLNKSDISFGDDFADSRLQFLRSILWPCEGEPAQDLLGTHFYLFMLAGWFSALNQVLRHRPMEADTVTIMDGSHYRVVAKAHRRAGISIGRLLDYFTSAAEPDLVVLLEIDPATSWNRRENFKETEMGRWDGHCGNPRDNYCTYQSNIQQVLSQFAVEHGWLVVRQGKTTTGAEIVDEICAHIAARAPQNKAYEAAE